MANANRFNWGSGLGIGGLLLAGCVVVVFVSTLLFGHVSGQEFDPETFARRRFSFYELPLVRWQVTPLYHTDMSGEIEQLVKSQSYVTPSGASQWHLLSLNRSSSKAPPTDAAILARYLDAQGEKYSIWWGDWSIRNPAQAKVLWPSVATLARLELYTSLPPVFETARTATDEKLLQTELTKQVLSILKTHAQAVETYLTNPKIDRPLVLKRISKVAAAGLVLAPEDAELLRLQKVASADPPADGV